AASRPGNDAGADCQDPQYPRGQANPRAEDRTGQVLSAPRCVPGPGGPEAGGSSQTARRYPPAGGPGPGVGAPQQPGFSVQSLTADDALARGSRLNMNLTPLNRDAI